MRANTPNPRIPYFRRAFALAIHDACKECGISDPARVLNATRGEVDHQAAPRLAVRARRCNGKGAELAVDVAAHGWPAIAAVTVLVAAVTACVLVWFIG